MGQRIGSVKLMHFGVFDYCSTSASNSDDGHFLPESLTYALHVPKLNELSFPTLPAVPSPRVLGL